MGIGFGSTSMMGKDAALGLLGLLDGLAQERPDLGPSYIVDGGKVYRDIEAVGGGDIHWWRGSDLCTLDCTNGTGVNGKARVEIPQGTKEDPMYSEVYAFYSEQLGGCTLLVADVIPSGIPHLKICYQTIQSHVEVASHGPMGLQRTTQVTTLNHEGLLDRMLTKSRKGSGGAQYNRGLEPDLTFITNASARDNVSLAFTSGSIRQANPQSVPAMSAAADGFFISGVNGAGSLKPLDIIYDLNGITEDGSGVPLNDGDSVLVDFAIHGNYSEADCKVVAYIHPKKYTSDADCERATREGRNLAMPLKYRGVGAWITRVALKYNTADSGTYSNILAGSQDVWREMAVSPYIQTENYPGAYEHNRDYVFNSSSPTTPHAYLTITPPVGTLAMEVYYDSFNMEAGYDYSRVSSASGTVLASFDNNRGAFWTQRFYGHSSLRISADTDGSVARVPGFRVTKAAYLLREVTGAKRVTAIYS